MEFKGDTGVYPKHPFMNDTPRGLPDFKNPPVTEVALSVQFEPLPALRTIHLGLLWVEFREHFPNLEEHPPRAPTIEEFEVIKPKKMEVQFQKEIPVLRCWFLNESGTELIQVQQDRFVFNWREVGEKREYPRYENVRRKFIEALITFQQFLDREQLGELIPNQCEVTYVNHIVQGEGWDSHGQLEKLFTVWASQYSDSFLREPEEAGFSVRYIIPSEEGPPIGRLHINVHPAFRREDGMPIIVMSLTARGRPLGVDHDDVLSFLDTGRKWIVRGFTSITTNEIHKIWERCDES
jgi:uncharacterized protein (TIGR04255 family)